MLKETFIIAVILPYQYTETMKVLNVYATKIIVIVCCNNYTSFD